MHRNLSTKSLMERSSISSNERVAGHKQIRKCKTVLALSQETKGRHQSNHGSKSHSTHGSQHVIYRLETLMKESELTRTIEGVRSQMRWVQEIHWRVQEYQYSRRDFPSVEVKLYRQPLLVKQQPQDSYAGAKPEPTHLIRFQVYDL